MKLVAISFTISSASVIRSDSFVKTNSSDQPWGYKETVVAPVVLTAAAFGAVEALGMVMGTNYVDKFDQKIKSRLQRVKMSEEKCEIDCCEDWIDTDWLGDTNIEM